MAKITAPLISMRARGQIGKAIVFGSWRGIAYARQHVIPANPQTVEQTSTRDTFVYLNSVFRLLGPLSLQPWDLASTGRPFTNRNQFIKSNLPILRGAPDNAGYTGSPGARGGPAFGAFVTATPLVSGEITATLTPGSLPAGWSIEKAVAHAITFGSPTGPFQGVMAEAEDLTAAPYTVTLTGLGSNLPYVVNGWFVYTRDDGLPAVSPSQSAEETSGI